MAITKVYCSKRVYSEIVLSNLDYHDQARDKWCEHYAGHKIGINNMG